MALVTPDGRWLRANRALCEILGRSEDELLALSFQEVTHPDDLGTDLALVADVLAGRRRTYELEKRYLRPDGTAVPVLLSVALVRDASGHPLHFVSQVQDLTGRKREHEAHLAQVLAAAQMGTWEADVASGRLRWDDQHARLFGVAPGGFGGTYDAFLAVVHPEDRARLEAAVAEALARCGAWEDEFRVVRPDGSVRWVLALGRTSCDEAGRAVRMLGVARDVTRRRRAAERAERLQRATAALAEALTTEEVARVVLAEGLAALGADAGGVGLVAGEGAALRFAALEGYGGDVAAPWAEVPVDLPAPATDALRARTPVFLARPAEMLGRYPHLGEPVAATGHRAWAALPLVASGRALGAWTLAWNAERRLGDDERAFASTLADQAAVALERARLFGDARARAERARRVQAVTAALSEALTVEQVAAAVAERVHPALGASGLVLRLVGDDGWLRVARAEGYGEAAAELFADLPPDAKLPAAEAVRRRPLFFGTPEAFAAAYPERARLAPLSGKRAWAFVPLVASGRAVGSWGIGFAAERNFSDDERALVATLAGVCAQALERARLYEAERDAAVALQRALLPRCLPEVDGATMAVRYLPGAVGAEAGGDWYDVVRLARGTVGVVVGDVGGHGVHAAALMGQVRIALRAYAAEGHRPAAVVARANRLLAELWPEELATCCYLEFDPAHGRATAVRAGHPPPLVLEPGGRATYAEVEAGLPLGVDAEAAYAETSLVLGPGATVVPYTDGLVESAAVPLGEGLERLAAAGAAAAPAGADPEALADALLGAVGGGGGAADDVALLVLRRAGDADRSPAARGLAARAGTTGGSGPLRPREATGTSAKRRLPPRKDGER